MSRFIMKPDPDLKRKWGVLAHVTEEERERILHLPFGETKPAIKRLEKEFAEFKKRPKPAYTIGEPR